MQALVFIAVSGRGGGEGFLGCHCDAAGDDAEEESPGYIDPECAIIVI